MSITAFRSAVALAMAVALALPAVAAPGGLSGVLEGPPGVSLAGYRLRFESDKGIAIETLPLGRDGRFRLAALPPGRYTVRLLTVDGRLCRVKFPVLDLAKQPTAEIHLQVPEEPVCRGARPGRWSKKRARRAWLIGGSVVTAAIVAAALGGGGEEPKVSPSSP